MFCATPAEAFYETLNHSSKTFIENTEIELMPPCCLNFARHYNQTLFYKYKIILQVQNHS